MRHTTLLLLPLLALVAAACGGGDGGTISTREPLSGRELEAASLITSQTGDVVMCRDNGAVGAGAAGHPIGYSCFNQGGEFYNVVVGPDGGVLSMSGPICLGGASASDELGFVNVPDCS